MEDITTVEKLSRILKGFLHENYTVLNDAYLEMFITHLAGKEYGHLLKSPCVGAWMEECLTILADDFTKLNPNVTALFLKVCALLTQNEWLVIQIREHDVAERIQKIIGANQDKLQPSIKLGHVRFLSAVSKHSLGLRWIKKAEAWRNLIDYCQKNQTVYVVREAREILCDILYKYSVKTNDEELCVEILREIVRPLLENVFQEDTTTVSVDDSELQRKLSPTLDLISYILQKTLENEQKTDTAHILATEFNLEVNLWKLGDMTQNQQFLGKILRVHTSFNFAKLIYEKWTSGPIAPEDFNQFGVNFFNFMKFCVSRKSCQNLLLMTELNLILWKKLSSRVPEEIMIENEIIQFENQLIMIHILPLLFILKSQSHPVDDYIMKLFAISCKFILRIMYAFRDVLLENPNIAADLAYKSINGILSIHKGLNQDRAVLVFQAMIYILKLFSSEEECGETTSTHLVMKIPNVLFAVLVGLQSLIQRYRITWKDSIETICLLNFLLSLLRNPNLTPRLAVQAIKLTQLSIEHFLSPHLALLVDNFNGSGMQNLGPMIMKRLHDLEWEVRDSTLELVCSITGISRQKYPAFQEYLLDNGICKVVVSMSKSDMEPYVRASAFKCLAQMVIVNVHWDKCLSQLDLMDHLLTALCVESEGIVRKEAVNLVTKIYYHRKIAPKYLDCVYSTLAHCAVNDLHWEVKINALYFWKVTVCRQFENQGMIDGTFPTVTFSKENKKIVTLTEKEILLRIQKVLNELSRRGCLGVILHCLNDECDLEVTKTAVTLLKILLGSLKKYDYLKALESDRGDPAQTPTTSKCSNVAAETKEPEVVPKETNKELELDSEKIIESIVTAQDINLLAEAYQNQMQVDADFQERKIDENLYKSFAEVKPIEFIKKVNSLNLDELVETRTNWIMNTQSFESLLDDMLFSIKTLEVNDADCY